MTVRLESLRITAEMDVSQYVRAAQQKNAADAAMVQSVKAVGQALAATDAATAKLVPGMTSLSRLYITGYGDAAKFESAVRSVGKALDKGMDPARAAIQLDALYKKFGQTADAAQLASAGFVKLAPIVNTLNSEYATNAKQAKLVADAQSEIARRTDAAAASMARMGSVQATINARLGVGAGNAGSAQGSADAFMAAYGGLDGIAKAKAQHVADSFTSELNARMVKGTAKSARDSASVFEESFKPQDELRKSIDKLTQSYDIVGAARQRHLEVEQTAAAGLKANLIDQTKYNTIVGQSKRVLDDTEKAFAGAYTAQNKFGTSTGLARHELVNFGRQAQDVFVSLASGQGVMTVLIQQVTQIFDIFASSRGTVGGFLSQIGPMLLRALPVIGAVTAAVGAMYAAFTVAGERQTLSNSLLGSGQASGLTGGQLAALAQESAASANITVSNSRLIAAEFVKLGQIARTNLPQLTRLTKDYAAATGTDLTTAAKELSSALADPARGAEMLGSKIGALDSSVIQAARTAGTFNERLAAMKGLMDAAGAAIEGAADRSMSKWDRLVKNIGSVYDKTKEAVAGAVLGPTATEAESTRLKQVNDEIRKRRELLNSGVETSSFYNPNKVRAEIKALEDEKAALESLQHTRQEVANDSATRTNNNAIINLGLETAKVYRALPMQIEEVEKRVKQLSEASEKAVSEQTDIAVKLQRISGGQDSDFQDPAYKAKGEEILKLGQAAATAKQQLDELRSIQAAGGLEAYKTGKMIELEAKYRGDNSLAAKANIAEQSVLIGMSGTEASATERNSAALAARNKTLEDARNTAAAAAEAVSRGTAAATNSAEAYRTLGRAAGNTAKGLAEVQERTRGTGEDANKVFGAEQAKRLAEVNAQLQERAAQLEEGNKAQAQANALSTGQSPSERARITREIKELEEERARLRAEGSKAGAAENAQLEKYVQTKRTQVSLEKQGIAQDYATEQQRLLKSGERQIELIKLSRGARYEELEVMKAQEWLWQQGISAESEKGKEILANARLLGKQNEQREIELKIMGQIRQAQDFAADSMKSFLSDLLTGTEGLTGALKNLGKGFLNASLDALISGKGPLAGITGLASATKDGQGGILGMATGGIQLFAKQVGKEVKEGAKEGTSTAITSSISDSGSGSWLSGLGINGKDLAGGLTAIAGLAGAYGAGAAAGSYGQAVGGGALSGGMAGLALAGTGLGASLGGAAVLGPIGLIVGGALAYFGQKAARDAAKKQREQEAQENYRQAAPGIETLRSQLRGENQDTLAKRIAATMIEVQKGIDVSFFAGKTAEANALVADFSTYKYKAIEDFQRALPGLIDSLNQGFGPNSAFASARDNVKSTGEALKGLVDDAIYAFGADSPWVGAAREAAKTQALAILDGAKSLTTVQTRMEEIKGAGAALKTILVELGMSATEAARAIEADTIAALNRLRDAFDSDVNSQINDAQGYGYVNEFNKLFAEYASKLADAERLGSTVDLAEWFRGQAQGIVNGSQIMGEAFQTLIAGWPQLAGVITEFTNGLTGAAKIADIAARKLAFMDRLFNATNPTDTLEGLLAAYNRTAIRERQEEIKKGGEALAELEMAQAAERYNIIRDWNQKILDEQKAAANEAKTFWEGFRKRIKEYLDGLRAGSESPLSPQARLAAAQSQYNAQLLLAQGGDRDAMNSITSYSNDLLDAARAYYASSTQFQDIFNQVIAQLGALPDQVSDTQLIIDAIEAGAQATVDELAIMRSSLTIAVNTGSAQQIAAALSTYFDKIDTNTSQTIDFNEMKAALGGMASDSALRAMFTRLDVDASGSLDKMELIKTATTNSGAGVSSTLEGRIPTLALAQISNNTGNTNVNASTIASHTNVISNNTAGANGFLNAYLPTLSTIAEYNRLIRLNVQSANGRIFAGGNATNAQPFATGGYVSGPGTGTSDSINARLSNGEFVLRKSAVDRIGLPALNFANDNGRTGFDVYAMVAELRALRMEVQALRKDTREGSDYVAGATATGAQHVRQGVDDVARNAAAAARAERRRAA